MKKMNVNLLYLWDGLEHYYSIQSPYFYDKQLDKINSSLNVPDSRKSTGWFGHFTRTPLNDFLKNSGMYSGHAFVNIPVSSTIVLDNPFKKLILVSPTVSPFLSKNFSPAYIVPKLKSGQEIKCVPADFDLQQLANVSFNDLPDATFCDVPYFMSPNVFPNVHLFNRSFENKQNYSVVRFDH